LKANGRNIASRQKKKKEGGGIESRGVQNNRLTEKTEKTEEKLTEKTEPK